MTRSSAPKLWLGPVVAKKAIISQVATLRLPPRLGGAMGEVLRVCVCVGAQCNAFVRSSCKSVTVNTISAISKNFWRVFLEGQDCHVIGGWPLKIAAVTRKVAASRRKQQHGSGSFKTFAQPLSSPRNPWQVGTLDITGA